MHADASHLSDDVCVDLILDQLSAADTRAARGHLATCSSCENRFRDLVGQWELAAVSSARLNPAARTLAAGAPIARAAQAIRSRFDVRRWLIPAAAVAAVVAIVVVSRIDFDPDLPPLTKLPAISETVRPRTALPHHLNETLMRGIDAYQREDFTAAALALDSVATDGPLDAFRRIYLASSLAWSGRYADASRILEDVPFDLVPEPWSSEARWTLYVALEATGESDRATVLLRELQSSRGPVGDRARSIQLE